MFEFEAASIFIAEILDITTTIKITNSGGFEGNPLVLLLGDSWAIVKLIMPLLLISLCFSLKRSELTTVQYRLTKGIVVFGVAMAFLPALNNILVLI